MTDSHSEMNPPSPQGGFDRTHVSPNPAPATFVILIKSPVVHALATTALQTTDKSQNIVAILHRPGGLKCVFWEETLQNYSAFRA